ncbi:unnamed protein product, partial [marine sediment metagenome]
MTNDLNRLSDTELIEAHSTVIRLLKERGIIHSKNVIGDLGEYLAIKYYHETPKLPKLQPAPPNTKNVDALSANGDRYNIKSTAGRVTSAFWGTKGLSFIFVPHEEFIQGKSYFSKLNSVLAWSPGKPDIVANLLGRTLEQKIKLVIRELDMFLTLICELKAQYEEAKVSLRQAPIRLNFEALERCHTEISYTVQESYPELLAKCEQARSEMRRFNEEIEVLKTIKSALPNITKPREGSILANPTEEQVAWLTLEWQPKYEVKEKRIREILRTLA